MKITVITTALVLALGGGAAWSQAPPIGDGGAPPPVVVGNDDDRGGGGGGTVPAIDADRDGFAVAVDCNDDAAGIKPGAVEIANALDDDCNGVVDDGFDTTVDWPRAELAVPVWPPLGAAKSDEFVSIDAAPRVVWTGDRFLAAWVDVRQRLRLAQIGPDGTVLGAPQYLRKPVRGLDVAWTGSRLGIVYEDVLNGRSAIRLMLVDGTGLAYDDVEIVASGSEPRIAWGQDRFGVVWKAPGGVINALRFQRFDTMGRPLSDAEALGNSGSCAAIAFSGTAVVASGGSAVTVHPGQFGIAYEAYYGFAASGDVLLTTRSLEPAPAPAPAAVVRVNQHDDPFNALGAMPAIAANAGGFMVAWHVVEKDADAAQVRFFSLADLGAVQEFTPDADLGRYGRMVWTGGEFVMANDNRAADGGEGLDVHVRRVDASGNTHLAAGWGPWSELRLREIVHGFQSAHPDIAGSGQSFGVVWIETDGDVPRPGGGRIWFASVRHD